MADLQTTKFSLASAKNFKYRAVLIRPVIPQPLGWRNRVKYLWGSDIWFGKIPVVKSMVLAEVLFHLVVG